MKQTLTWAFWLSFLASAGLTTAGVREFYNGEIDANAVTQPLLVFDQMTKPVGDVESKRQIPVDYRVTNRGDRPLHILGSTYTCTRQGCLRGSNLAVEILPGKSEIVHAVLYAGAAGNLRASFRIYTDAPGQEQVKLTVTGRTISPAGKSSKLL